FAVQHSHDHLDVAATSRLQVSLGTRPWEHLPEESWTDLKEDLSKVTGNGVMERLPFSLTSSHCPTAPEFANYAESSFQQYEGAFSACSALMHRIFEELDYVPGVTTVNSSVYDILQDKRGVCQDFAHLMISCLRSLGLAARYVSGYLETLPPEGQPKMKGSDASHAWVEVFLGNQGWVPFDPTNDCCPRAQHLVLAYGRDFSDVQPHYGIFTVAGYRPPKVEVDVSRM
ncbi:MAG: transglutaminase family protein, partial [Verrucomicrobiota bacterium]